LISLTKNNTALPCLIQWRLVKEICSIVAACSHRTTFRNSRTASKTDRVYVIHRWLLGLAPFIWMEATSDSCGIVNLLGITATISH
jgi:hypothetical protein